MSEAKATKLAAQIMENIAAKIGVACRGRAFLALAFVLALAASTPTAALAQLATVSIQAKTLGRQIPRNFVGLSLEVSTGGQGLQPFKAAQPAATSGHAGEQDQYALGHPGAPNTGFFRFMRDLGPGILRLGGNSQDNTCWDPAQAPHPKRCKATLNNGDLRLFSTAAEDSGWRLILGLNLKQNSPSWALREITEGVNRDINPHQIFAFEIGNEPDLFRRGARPATYSSADYVKDFLGYLNAFRQNPVARKYAVVGPATCCEWRNPRDLGVFIDGVGAKNLKLATVHNYSRTTCGGRTVSIAQLLDASLMDHFNQQAKALVAAAQARGVPIALAETNSVSCGGMPGVSNAFASSVWGLDYMFSVAEDGFQTINFHISYRPGGGSSYNPVDTFGREEASHRWQYHNVAEPLYYAMYFFARNASGDHLLPTTIKTSANVRAYAVSSCAGCAVKVFVINKDLSAAGQIRVRLNRGMGKGSLLLLKAPRLNSLATGVRYGGVQFSSDGRLPPPHSTAVQPDAQGVYTFTLPNAAAALLTVAPSRAHHS